MIKEIKLMIKINAYSGTSKEELREVMSSQPGEKPASYHYTISVLYTRASGQLDQTRSSLRGSGENIVIIIN